MITPRHLTGIALILCWAMLLSARTLAAAIYATRATASFEIGYHYQGWTLLLSAWGSLIIGICLLRDCLRTRVGPTLPPA